MVSLPSVAEFKEAFDKLAAASQSSSFETVSTEQGSYHFRDGKLTHFEHRFELGSLKVKADQPLRLLEGKPEASFASKFFASLPDCQGHALFTNEAGTEYLGSLAKGEVLGFRFSLELRQEGSKLYIGDLDGESRKDGQGKYFARSSVDKSEFDYEGGFRLNEFDGPCKLRYFKPEPYSLRLFEGNYSKGKMAGDGTKTSFDQSGNKTVCVGDWADNALEQGTVYFSDGSVFRGQLDPKKQQPHGLGRKVHPDETAEQGVWEEGVLKEPRDSLN